MAADPFPYSHLPVDGGGDTLHRDESFRQQGGRDRLGSVGEGVLGVGVRLEQDGVSAGGNGTVVSYKFPRWRTVLSTD